MKVDLPDGTQVQIWFRHEPAYTYCTIEKVPNDVGNLFLAVGKARLHPNDKYCKATGRRVSLARALEAMEEVLEEQKFLKVGEEVYRTRPAVSFHKRIFDAEARRAIWKAYFEHHADLRK